MSNQFSYSTSSFSYSSNTSSSGGHHTGTSERTQTFSDSSGTTVRKTSQNLGGEPVSEVKHYDAQGRQLPGGHGSSERRIEDVTDADKEYEERIDDEYAKRQGGAQRG